MATLADRMRSLRPVAPDAAYVPMVPSSVFNHLQVPTGQHSSEDLNKMVEVAVKVTKVVAWVRRIGIRSPNGMASSHSPSSNLG